MEFSCGLLYLAHRFKGYEKAVKVINHPINKELAWFGVAIKQRF